MGEHFWDESTMICNNCGLYYHQTDGNDCEINNDPEPEGDFSGGSLGDEDR